MSNSTGRSVSEPTVRPAATLVLLRDGAAGLEVLLTERPRHLRFMGGAMVFPGGAVAAADHDPRWANACTMPPARRLAAVDADATTALAAHVCALREAFEEVGLLLSEGEVRLSRAEAHDPGRFLEGVLAAGVTLAASDLVHGGRWVTPIGSPVRFDAHFFLARAPEGWTPEPDPAEVASAEWVSPSGALAGLAAGRTIMAPPTIEVLQRLQGPATVDDALSALANDPVGRPGILSTRVSPLVRVVLAPNPGTMTGPGTNSYVVGSGPTFVIDPAVPDEEYIETLVSAAGEIAAILVTHRHGDHTGGVSALAGRTGRRVPVRAWSGEPVDGIDPDPLRDGETLSTGDATLQCIYTPGHASDHVCFYSEKTATLFAGDSILGEGTAVIAPPDGDMRAYLASLERLRELHLERIFTGHFRPLDGGLAVIESYIAHRREREAMVLSAVGAAPVTVEEVVAAAYADTPVELHPIAALSALAHLEMLAGENRVERVDDRWRLRDVE